MALTPEQKAEALAAQTAALKNQVKLRKELNQLTKQQIDFLLNNQAQANKLSLDQGQALVSLQIQRQKNLDLLEKEIGYYQKLSANAKTESDRSNNQLKALQARIDKQKELVKEGKAERESVEDLENQYEQLDESIKNAKKTSDELVGAFGDLLKGNLVGGLKKLGGALTKNLKNKLMSKFTDSIFSLVRAGPKGIAALGGLAAAFVVIGVAVAVWTKIVKMAIAVVDASNAFQKATGTSNEFASSLITVGNEARAFGGTIEEVSASFQSLFTNVSDFTMMSRASREELIKTNTVLSKLGISNDDLAKSQQNLIKAMGQTATQAAATSRELAAFASDIGVAPSKLASDFAAAGPQLAKFGRDGVKAFKDLAQTAKITGIEVSRLLAITEKFDTFEGAAEQAGKLNAALGGNFVNAMELLTETDPTKRFEQMTDAIKDAGKSFDDMTYFEAKFFAQAMGLQDVNELALALSGNMDMVGQFTKKSSDQYEALAKRAAKVQSFQEKMNTLMAQLIPIVEPIVDGLMAMSDWMSENLDAVAFGFKVIISAVTGLAVALTLLGIAMAFAFAPAYAGAIAIIGLVAAIGSLAALLAIDFGSPSIPEGLEETGNGLNFVGESAKFSTARVTEMNVAMQGAATQSAAAATEANNYAMSQFGDTVTNNNNGSQIEQIIHVQIGDDTVDKVVRKSNGRQIRSVAVGG